MREIREYTVRPYKPGKASLKDAFRIQLSAAALRHHGFQPGDLCRLSNGSQSSFAAIAWLATDVIQDSIVQTTEILRHLYGLSLRDKVVISYNTDPILDTVDVVLFEIQDQNRQSQAVNLERSEEKHWAWLLEHELKHAEILCPGMLLTNVRAKGQERTFQVATVNGSEEITLYRSLTLRSVVISNNAPGSPKDPKDRDAGPYGLDSTAIGGLDSQISRLNAAMAAYDSSADTYKSSAHHRLRRGGVILHGPSGTGKSMLLRMVSHAGWRKAFHIYKIIGGTRVGEGEALVRDIFTDAHRQQPSVVIIDNLDALAGKDELTNNSRYLHVASMLCEEFDKRRDSRIFVIAATRNVALINETLRCPGRFETEIEIPVPGADARAEILSLAVGLPKKSCDPQLVQLANRTHGYVGSDLDLLVQVAMDKAFFRTRALGGNGVPKGDSTLNEKPSVIGETVLKSDVEAALLEVQPTAMKEIFLETPKVKWSDIGGQTEAKKALQKAIEWPLKVRYRGLRSEIHTNELKHYSEMKRLGRRPKKGLLLYGPPGCSKTLVAKAVATESELNFIAVKGAEVLSMYVGESERAVREVFRRARAASPSVVFFDEVDAIGASREHSPQSGVHVLTTLLNELDGIEARNGVFVLAATNRPEILDPALLRPGRLESAIYVGVPDYQARYEILAIETQKMDIAEDFNAATLADKAEGYSGAELVEICQQAIDEALDEQLETEKQQKVAMEHFERALGKARKHISPEMINKYEAWGAREMIRASTVPL
ncbi:MAG: hypothetical protein Q9201_006647 [Fulgogasparrea decipioides]